MSENQDRSHSLQGRCLCGDIEFRCDHPGKPITVCHCVQCRQWGGSPWAATSVPFNALKITKGKDSLRWFVSSDFARRGFCPACGSSLFWHADRHSEWSGSIAIAAGSLLEPTHLAVERHIWCKSKGDYYRIEGDLPQDQEE